MKKLISILLIFSMIFSSFAFAFAEDIDTETELLLESVESEELSEEDAKASEEALAEWEASLGEYTETPVNAYTPVEQQNLLTAEDTGHAYNAPAAENAEETEEQVETVPAEYVEGEVLFSRSNNEGLLKSEKTDKALAKAGVSEIEEVITFEETETTWYKAKIDGDVEKTVETLTEIGGVEEASPNFVYKTEVVGEPTEVSAQWYIQDAEHGNKDNNGLHKGWYKNWKDTYTEGDSIDDITANKAPGEGVVVAVIDTGVDYNHKDLAANMWVNSGEIPDNGIDDDGNGYIDDVYGIDTTADPNVDGAIAGDPMDYNGHGTHVAGIIAMSGNGEGGVGIAYGAKIMAIKAGQATGSFASSDIAEAIKYAKAMGADVINMSFGGSGQSALVKEALEDAYTTCVLVAAAGNNGLPTNDAQIYGYWPTEDIYPAAYNFVIGVMASDEQGNKALFSNWDFSNNANAEYEMIAPGTNIYSTIPGNKYAKLNGTSMAAPMVAAAAAILRGYFNDKAEYNSRFIMGQLASATEDSVSYIGPKGDGHSYASLNLYDSMVNLPKPNIFVSETFVLDNVTPGTINDGDGIMDAGETISLGIAIRNQWGKTGTITVKADAKSDLGVDNPYVEFITDEITLSSAGTFQTVDNGFVYEDGYLCDITNPISFRIANNVPNDTEVKITFTVTTTNGWDVNDTVIYTPPQPPKPSISFRVQKGIAVNGHITGNVTWTKDNYYIIQNAVLIDPNAKLTIQPGTQVQFWSSDSLNPYGDQAMAFIKNDGTLNAIGTEEEPIEMFPGAEFEFYVCDIRGGGNETLKYCTIRNPRFTNVNLVDHCELVQDYPEQLYRQVSEGIVNSNYTFDFSCATLTNSRIKYFITGYGYDNYYRRGIFVETLTGCEFDNCSISIQTDSSTASRINGNTLLGGNYDVAAIGSSMQASLPDIPDGIPEIEHIFSYDNAQSKYVIIGSSYRNDSQRALSKALAREMGGTLLCFNSQDEINNVTQAVFEVYDSDVYSGTLPLFFGLEYNAISKTYSWDDGSSVVLLNDAMKYDSFGRPLANGVPDDDELYYFSFGTSLDYCNFGTSVWSNSWNIGIGTGLYRNSPEMVFDAPYVLEVSAGLTDEEIYEIVKSFDYDVWKTEYYGQYGYINNCAILNPILDTDTNHWLKFTAPLYNRGYYQSISNNYWGTENSILINKMIIDDDDFPGTYADIQEKPILTLESEELENIYPFVTQIWVEDEEGNKIGDSEAVAPGKTYEVHVTYNRDMATDVQPQITYGGEAPFTDYGVYGNWVKENSNDTASREWVGTEKISNVATGGNMIFRAVGGAAANDKWLVCGTDDERFQFSINSVSAQSVVLNATGGNGKIDLSWFQNDYELLSGYKIYRSTNATSGFVPIYTAAKGEDKYTDTNVADGVTYYYYFTIVDTDGNEVTTSESNHVSAAPKDRISPIIQHTKVSSAVVGQDITISAQASDNIGVKNVRLYYKKTNDANYASLVLTRLSGDEKSGNYVGKIPASYVTTEGVLYYLEVEDTTGNKAQSGFPQGYSISTNNKAIVNAVFPQTIEYGYDGNITLYGSNFSSASVVKIGSTTIDTKTVNDSCTEITFKAPALAVGTHDITVDGVVAAKKLVCQDSASFVQIYDAEVASGNTVKLPVYVGAKGEMKALRIEANIPSANYNSVSYENADGVSVAPTVNYRSSVLTISFANATDFNPGSSSPIGYIVLVPKAVSTETPTQITLTVGKVNDADANILQSATVTVFPNFSLTAIVKYFVNSIGISGVQIKADDVIGNTGSNGSVALSGIKRAAINVYASKSEDIEDEVDSIDALYVLKYCAYNNLEDDGQPILGANQIIAADVNGDGYVTEMDASLILQKAVKLIPAFSVGNWIFIESPKSMTLTNTSNTVNFTAILAGDVDGSYRN